MIFRQAWDLLLWCDPANYGGVRSKLPTTAGATTGGAGTPVKRKNRKGNGSDEEEEDDNDDDDVVRGYDDDEGQEEEEEEDEGPDLEMNWNLASYLPVAGACQKNFATVVAGYISAVYQFMQDELERVAPGSTPVRRRRRQSQQATQSQASGSHLARRRALVASETGSAEDPLEAYSRELIRGELTQRLFALTQKINKKLPEQVRKIYPTNHGPLVNFRLSSDAEILLVNAN